MLLCWAISVSFVLASMVHVGFWLELWSLLYSTFFFLIALGYEKHGRLVFLEKKKIALIESSRRELLRQVHEAKRTSMEKDHESKLIFIQTEEEKRLFEKEREALTALIGNVAHDLKTPLQSFVLGLEFLKTRITQDYVRLPHSSTVDEDEDQTVNTLCSLNSACDFMRMAINRSIDFAKFSGNISLVPAMETFNIVAALSIPLNIMKHLQSAIKIVANPLPLNLSEDLISDKHWFSENVLCLLSNAVQYSDGGTVTVSIEVVESSAKGNNERDSKDEPEYRGPLGDHPLSSIRISIEDTGIGLSKNARDTLFQPFKQAQRLAGGTGLGLFSLSKRIEALGGLFGVDDRKDGKRGSNFWFFLVSLSPGLFTITRSAFQFKE
jgi:signal transduction histidine kinase